MTTDESTIRANRFVLEDKDGKARAELSLICDRPALKLFSRSCLDKKGKGRMDIFQPRPSLALCDKNGKEHAALCIDNGGFLLLLLDENGKGRASLGVSAGRPWLNFFDENGEAVWRAP